MKLLCDLLRKATKEVYGSLDEKNVTEKKYFRKMDKLSDISN